MKSMKRLLAFALAFILLIGALPTSVFAVSDNLKDAYNATYEKLSSVASSDSLTIGSTNGEWLIIGLARSQQGIPAAVKNKYIDLLKTYLPDHIKKNGQMYSNWITKQYIPTENERISIALSALGYDPSNFNGYNLLKALEEDTDALEEQGNNALTFALIAYNAAGYNGKNESEIINRLLSAQKSNGTWTVSKTDNSMPTDMTAMVIQGLSSYYSNANVKTAVDKGLAYLRSIQKSTGSIDDNSDPETSAQALIAILSVGVDPTTDSRFLKNGKTLLDAIYAKYLSYYQGFKHGSSNSYNVMATEQAFYALVAFDRFAKNKTSLYDMSDVEKVADKEAAAAVIAAIEALPADVTLEHKAAVEGARSAYEALSAAQKPLVTNLSKLTAAEEKISRLEADKAAADAVAALIDHIGEVTLAKESDITAARGAYDKLTPVQKNLVANYEVLTDAESALDTLKAQEAADKAAASKAEDMITALPDTVTLGDKGAVDEAKAAYDHLTASQKTYVSDEAKTKLKNAAARITELETARSQAIAFKEEIDKLPTAENAKLKDKDAINAGKQKYDALSAEAKSFVESTYTDKLKGAAEEISRLEAKNAENQRAADAVIQKIDAIGTVTLDRENAIAQAREAYDVLESTTEKDLKSQRDLVTNYSVLLQAESTLAAIKADNADKAAANAVVEKINAIGTVEYNNDCKLRIDAARAAYHELNDTRKALVGEALITLENAEKTYGDMAAAEPVKAAIAAIGDVAYSDAVKAKIDAARAGYNGLNAAQQKYVDNYSVLTAAEATYNDMGKAADVDRLIAAIGSPVTLASESKITAAREAFDALSASQKAHVHCADTLTAAESTLTQLKKDKADKDAANTVIEKINGIGTVTKDSKEAIDAARAAYNALTEEQKALVVNYAVLESAEQAYAGIPEAEDAAAAKSVEEEIKALPADITLGNKDAVAGARERYNNLTDAQKAKVSADTLAKLTAAEAKITALEKSKVVTDELAAMNVADAKQATLNKINSVKDSYSKLKDDEKALVAEYDTKIAEIEAAFHTYLEEAKSDAAESLKKFYDSLDKEDYAGDAWEKVDKLYNDGAASLKECGYKEEIDTKLRGIVANINTVEKGKRITVTFRLVGAELASQEVDLAVSAYLPAYVTWIPTTSINVNSGSTVYDVYTKAMNTAGLSSEGANNNYVSSITAPGIVGGYDLDEFTNGMYSGWMYIVNGTHPNVGLQDCSLKDGDVIVWHYVNDYRYEVADWFDGSSGSSSTWNGWLKAPDTAPTAPDVIKLKDVKATDWYYDDVKFVTNKGLFVGTGNGMFQPNLTMTRAMLVTVLYRLEGEPSVAGTSKFGDVKADSWYTDAVIWAENNGIIKGLSENTFGTYNDVTREQTATILHRYAQYKGYNTTQSNNLSGYADKDKIGNFAIAAMQWANAEKLINGRTETTLVPKGNATRAEVAAIIHRFCDNVVVG